MKRRKCALCRREQLGEIYYEDRWIWVTDCKTCDEPLGVLKRHTSNPKPIEIEYLVFRMKELFPDSEIDYRMRAIPEHFHVHAR